MVAATLVDIIRRFKVNKTSVPDSKEELYSDFPEKVRRSSTLTSLRR